MFNWIAGFITLLIVAAFFWPQSKQANDTINPFDNNKIQKENSSKVVNRTNTFSRPDDNDRAQSFRQTDTFDRKIRVLVDEAQKLFDKQSYTLPKERNAMVVYREILQLSPNNSVAIQGIEAISENLLGIGQRALKNDKLARANRTLKKLIDIDQESVQTILLTSDISNWHENKKWRDLIKLADQAFEAENYIAPATKNALYYYEQTLLLDKANLSAKTGIIKILDIYAQKAQTAIDQGDLSDASTNLEILLEIDPLYPLLKSLQDELFQAQELSK